MNRPAAGALLAAVLLLASCSSPARHGIPEDPGRSPAGAPQSGAAAVPSAATSPATGRPATGSPARRSPAPSSAAGPSSAPSPGRWRPSPGTPWQWQLSGTVDTSVRVPVYDIDGFENGADVVRRLHAAGRRVICYVNAGAWESFRPDAEDFPAAVLGKGDGWQGERWLDIRRTDVLRPLLAARFDMCRAKGFDAVEPDLLDGYTNDTGFPLTAAHQLAFNRMVAGLARQRGLAVGLKNDVEQVGALVDVFDFAVDEQCAQFDECEALRPFTSSGKAVLHVEYELRPDQFCSRTAALGFSSMAKHLSLDAWRQPC